MRVVQDPAVKADAGYRMAATRVGGEQQTDGPANLPADKVREELGHVSAPDAEFRHKGGPGSDYMKLAPQYTVM